MSDRSEPRDPGGVVPGSLDEASVLIGYRKSILPSKVSWIAML